CCAVRLIVLYLEFHCLVVICIRWCFIGGLYRYLFVPIGRCNRCVPYIGRCPDVLCAGWCLIGGLYIRHCLDALCAGWCLSGLYTAIFHLERPCDCHQKDNRTQ